MLSMLLFNSKHLNYFHDLCKVMPEKLHIFIIVHPPFIKKDRPKSVMVTASLGGSTKHHLAHSQFFFIDYVSLLEKLKDISGHRKSPFCSDSQFLFSFIFFILLWRDVTLLYCYSIKSLKKEVTVDG